ncbi:MAG: hypothetical protein RIB67_07320 [Miltoncostaeaceae bacterium]
MSRPTPHPPTAPAPSGSAIEALEAAMRRRGIRVEIRLTPSSTVRASAHASGLLAREPGHGEGATLREALRALALDLHEKGA